MDQFPLEQIVEKAGSRFAVVIAAAQRARQIKEGSPPLVTISSRNPLTIALAEIAQGKVLIEPAGAMVEEEAKSTTVDEYFAGREEAVDDLLPYRREAGSAASVAGDELDDEAEEEELDEDEVDDLVEDEE